MTGDRIKSELNKRAPKSIWVQSVLYNNDLESIDRALSSLARSAELAHMEGIVNQTSVVLGDSSPSPCISEVDLKDLHNKFGHVIRIFYDFFNGNLGSAGGHNRLASENDSDFIVIRNPDTIVCPRMFEIMLATFDSPNVGMVEAKQIPIEHPKAYDVNTGDTSWASTACAMIPSELFRELGGFDDKSFFLYCDDVDFSWRVRLLGYRVVFQPAAVLFHDKRLSTEGMWQPTSAERFYSAEAALIMAHKWSRPDLVEKILKDFSASTNTDVTAAKTSYLDRLKNGSLPVPLDQDNRIGSFILGNYGEHRFYL
jgi:GT2 family glycosyltransferase